MITIRKRTLYIWVAVLILLFICYFIFKNFIQSPNQTPLSAYPNSTAVQAEKPFGSYYEFICSDFFTSYEYQAYNTEDSPYRIINYYSDKAEKLSKIEFKQYAGYFSTEEIKDKIVNCFEDQQGKRVTFKVPVIFDNNNPQDAAFIQKHFANATTKRYQVLLFNGIWYMI